MYVGNCDNLHVAWLRRPGDRRECFFRNRRRERGVVSGFSLPWYSGGGLGWGVIRDLRFEISDRPPPLPTPGVPGEGEKVSVQFFSRLYYVSSILVNRSKVFLKRAVARRLARCVLMPRPILARRPIDVLYSRRSANIAASIPIDRVRPIVRGSIAAITMRLFRTSRREWYGRKSGLWAFSDG